MSGDGTSCMEGRGLSPLPASVVWSSAGCWCPSLPGQLCPWLSIAEAAGSAPSLSLEPAEPAGPLCVLRPLGVLCKCLVWSPLLRDGALKGTWKRESSLAEVTWQTATTPSTRAPVPGGMGPSPSLFPAAVLRVPRWAQVRRCPTPVHTQALHGRSPHRTHRPWPWSRGHKSWATPQLTQVTESVVQPRGFLICVHVLYTKTTLKFSCNLVLLISAKC